MLIAAVVAAAAVVVTALLVYRLGDGNVRRGRVRAVRRIRTARRRFLRPLLGRLERTASAAWTRPARTSVAGQVRRVANRIERASAAAERFATAQRGLSSALDRIREVGPAAWAEASPYGQRRSRDVVGNGWAVAILLALAGAAVAAGNGWVLYRHVIPTLPDLAILPAPILSSLATVAFIAALPYLLGLAYFALNSAGRPLGFKVLAVVVALLVVGLAGLEAAAVVVALERLALAEPSWWGGVAVATLLGGTAALAPPTVAALAHSAIERLDRWLAARERRAAGRAVARQDRLAGQLRATLDAAATSVDAMRSEVLALASEPGGRLLLHPGERPTVERAGAVLRRLAATVERDPEGWTDGKRPAGTIARFLGDLAVLVVWAAAGGSALILAAAALRRGAQLGVPSVMTVAAFLAVAGLLVAGLVFRLILAQPGTRTTELMRGAGVALLGLATASLSIALGTLVARVEAGIFAGQPVVASAWINLLVLVAAVASVRIPEAVTGVAAAGLFLLAVAAWLLLALVDTALAVVDRVLTGLRRRARSPLSAPPGRPRPAARALGGERPRR